MVVVGAVVVVVVEVVVVVAVVVVVLLGSRNQCPRTNHEHDKRLQQHWLLSSRACASILRFKVAVADRSSVLRFVPQSKVCSLVSKGRFLV